MLCVCLSVRTLTHARTQAGMVQTGGIPFAAAFLSNLFCQLIYFLKKWDFLSFFSVTNCCFPLHTLETKIDIDKKHCKVRLVVRLCLKWNSVVHSNRVEYSMRKTSKICCKYDSEYFWFDRIWQFLFLELTPSLCHSERSLKLLFQIKNDWIIRIWANNSIHIDLIE